MKKALLFTLAVMMIASCAEQQGFDSQAWEAPAQLTNTEDIEGLMAKAKWGDAAAYLNLAECYKDGRHGVKPDFLTTMTMLSMAREYGGLGRPEEYIRNLPDDDNTRMAFEAMENLDNSNVEKGIGLAERLIEKGCAEGYAFKGYALFLQGDSIGAMSMAAKAAERGSSLGTALQYIIPYEKMKEMPDESILMPLAESVPIFYLFMAEEYVHNLAEHPENDAKAARAYLRADEKGCLDRRGADWLLAYMECGNELPISEEDIQRLRILADAGDREVPREESSVPETKLLEEAVDSVADAEEVIKAAEEAVKALEDAKREYEKIKKQQQ